MLIGSSLSELKYSRVEIVNHLAICTTNNISLVLPLYLNSRG
jgi:hypothetical protein